MRQEAEAPTYNLIANSYIDHSSSTRHGNIQLRMSPHGRMQNPSQDLQQTALPSAHLSEPLRQEETKKDKRSRDEYCENADSKDSAVVWADSSCMENENTAGRRQAVTLMRRFYRHATRVITRIGPEVENGSRKIKLSRRTKNAIAFVFACLCAAQLMQKPSGKTRTETYGIKQPQRGATAYPSGPSRWSANAQEELLPEFGDQKTLLNVLKKYASLVECVHIPTFLSRPHPLLLLITNVVFAFPITYLRYTNRRDKYQDEIIAGGMVLTIAVASMMSGNIWEIAMPLLPWSIILGLVLSSSIHRVFGCREEER